MNLPRMGDRDIERMVAIWLRIGVMVAGAVVLAGGIFYLLHHGGELADHRTFHGQPAIDRIVTEIFAGALALRARSIIQLGVLVLIATPIMRVALALAGFALERDRRYTIVTLVVLCVLVGSLIAGVVEA